ncbi:MAG: 2-succinyl-5-enolpyruvyl-6-hydroxy-3-cyclohexene-carboxylate synthase, partial [Actinomycetota bacterium]
MSTSTDLARSYIKYLIESGVSNFVLSPGSRNAPLSIALNDAFEKGLINLHVKLDERGAAYFALGISKATDSYVAVICTSGTAVANYAPAALEAFHGDDKVIFLTADRPARLRKTGANQTTNQVDIFNGIKTHDIATFEEIRFENGPIHINLQFDEPLLSTSSNDWLSGIHRIETKLNTTTREKLSVVGNGLIVVGHDKGGFSVEAIEKFADGLVLISEDPLSFKGAISHASVFLADEKVRDYLKPDYVIVIGRTTLSRSINAFVASAPRQYVIDSRIKRIDTSRSATQLFENLPELDI